MLDRANSAWVHLSLRLSTEIINCNLLGEDSEDLSAAGQNETILGCRGKENIVKAVAKCWASLYTFQSVEYRR